MGVVEWISVGMVLIAAYFDLRWLRIPNRLQIVAGLLVWGAGFLFASHTWEERALSALLLTVIFFVAWLMNQTGGGDVKMMLWFGFGFGFGALCMLSLAAIGMLLWRSGYWLIRREAKLLPLGPFLAVGMIVWKCVEPFIGVVQ